MKRAPKYIKVQGKVYERISKAKPRRRVAVRYWFGTEEAIEGMMGIEDIELPFNAVQEAEELAGMSLPSELLDSALESYKTQLYELAPEPDYFLDAVKTSVEKAISDMVDWDRYENRYLEAAADRLIEGIGDNFAHEALFGAIGGVPEYGFWVLNNYDREVEDELGLNADDVFAAAQKAEAEAGEQEWKAIEEDVRYAFEQANDGLVESLVEEVEEWKEDQDYE